MRDPRTDPRKGDVLRHADDGECRKVVSRSGELAIRYVTQDSGLSAVCSTEQWRQWAMGANVADPNEAKGA
jgi:hypothetical protein